MPSNKVIVVGAGIGGLAVATLLAKKGYDVSVFEKNEQLGGRCSILRENGFMFDMGPSWYLMPDVFEHFYSLLSEDIKKHLELVRLKPAYKVFFKDENKVIDINDDLPHDLAVFESLEPGSASKMKQYLEKSKEHYDIAMQNFIYKNYNSIFDFFSFDLIREGLKLSIFSKMQKYVEKYFKSTYLQKLTQYQLVFLGNSPYNAPAIYNIMSHVDFDLGVFYPMGGIYKITDSIKNIGEKLGVKYHVNSEVVKILTADGKARGIKLADGREIYGDLIIADADLHHVETDLLEAKDRSYSDKYWDKRVVAPSGLILYLGISGKIDQLNHHNLVFSKDWKKNFAQIFDKSQWPDDPSFYVCMPSKLDKSVAPENCENLFVFVPIASGLRHTDELANKAADMILETMAREMKIPDLKQRIIYKKIFSVNDFKSRYNSFRGSALGLAHTLFQTAVFRPDNRSKKVKNLYYVGGNTNPGIGLPMCLISAELAYKRIVGDRTSGPLKRL